MTKFFTAEQIADSIGRLADVHSFHGITYLACKLAKLAVGLTTNFPMDATTKAFLQAHHRVDPKSAWFLQPFKSSDASKKWVKPNYASTGLQAVNTQTFRDAFIHEHNTQIWAWSKDYVAVLVSKLLKKKQIPAFHLAVWLFREKAWKNSITNAEIVQTFMDEFLISQAEQAALFDSTPPSQTGAARAFSDRVYTWPELRVLIPMAPDAKPDQGGTLAYLETVGLGPSDKLVLEPADRLTLITGDNGLGKTFILECCWWALTGTWAGKPALAKNIVGSRHEKAEITFAIQGESAKAERRTIEFDWKSMSWPAPKKRPTIPGLIVYARVDGSFAVWDPAKQGVLAAEEQSVFSSADVWNGLNGRIEGLVRDWVRWQSAPGKSPFNTFRRVLAHLSPPDLGTLEPGEPVRIPGDPRDIPTIKHPYGVTPIVYSSAGVRRIITLAYLVVWAWTEHVVAAEMTRSKPQNRIVILVDEMEAHLHPRWQRAVLPALLSVQQMLSPELQAQYIVATHSPLVMASSETVFDPTTDALVHLDLVGGKVSLEEIDFVKFGDVSSWLTSPVFELRQARNSETEAAIEDAKKLQLNKSASRAEVEEVSQRLVRYLGGEDKFWPRWIYFAEQHGVKL